MRNAECGIEGRGRVTRRSSVHSALPIPHSAFEGGARVEGLILAIDTATDIASAAVGIDALRPLAASLLLLAARVGAARELPDPLAAEPVYGRPAEAQAKWEARHGRPLPDP